MFLLFLNFSFLIYSLDLTDVSSKPTPRDAWNTELSLPCPARLLQAGQPQTHVPTSDFTQCPCVLLSSQKVLEESRVQTHCLAQPYGSQA